jgi:multidrug efflux pump subunit AcrA (membrane-fusion protein)
MKTLRVCGWAVIFTVTLLLAACATNTPKVADTSMMSGPDVTMTQQEAQEQSLERRENALVITQAWLDEREMQLDLKEAALDRRENAVAINQAWLDEREMQLARTSTGLTKPDDLLTFRETWRNAAEGMVAEPGSPRTKVESGRCYASVVYPAEYKTVAVVKPIETPKGENLPVLYQSVTEKVKVTDEQTRWEEILCQEDLTECRVIEVQRALSRGGYSPGPIDGIIGLQTMAAINAFQKDFNLTVADYLTIETVRALDSNF